MTDVARKFMSDPSPMAKALAMRINAGLLLKDVESIKHNTSSAGPFILIAHAIELSLKAYVKAAPARKGQATGHDLEIALNDAEKVGLVCSDPASRNVVERLSRAVKKAKLRYVFDFHDLPLPIEALRVARAIHKDIGALVRIPTDPGVLYSTILTKSGRASSGTSSPTTKR